MLLCALLFAQQLPPIALPSAAQSQTLERDEVDHVLVITLAYLQMDSQPLVPLEQGTLPLAARPALELALDAPRSPDGACPEESTLLVVADRRLPSLTQQLLKEALKGSCFTSTWALVEQAPALGGMSLPKASEPITLQSTVQVVPWLDPAPHSLGGDTLSAGLAGPKRLGATPGDAGQMIAEPMILGPMDGHALKVALAEQEAALQACADQAPAPGRVLMKFTVDEQGQVSELNVESGMQSPEAESCITEVLQGMALAGSGASVTVILPLNLTPHGHTP